MNSTKYENQTLLNQAPDIKLVRDCVEGSPAVKKAGYTYLPHPSEVETTGAYAKQRYREFLAGAEFDGEPDQTRRKMLGKMRLGKAKVELPDTLDYLLQDADGDGLSLFGAIEHTGSNVLQTKYHFVLADWQGLPDVGIESLTIADVESADPHVTFKQYTRDSLVNYHFEKINGRNQLSFIMFKEVGSTFDKEQFKHKEVVSYQILALDNEGNYYQQKIVKSDDGEQVGDPSPVTVGNEPLKFIPIVIVADEELQAGYLPSQLGFLYPICEASLHKYRVSAVYKETQRDMRPTPCSAGWTRQAHEDFKEINQRDSFLTGVHNALPEGVEVDILSLSTDMDDFHWYFEYTNKKIMSMGGSVKQEMSNMTATEADINASEQNAMLETLADNLESSFKELIFYAGVFHGLWSQDDELPEDVVIDLPRDFATPKLTVEEVSKLYEGYTFGVYSLPQVVNLMVQGGWSYLDAETHIAELEDAAPTMGASSSRETELDE